MRKILLLLLFVMFSTLAFSQQVNMGGVNCTNQGGGINTTLTGTNGMYADVHCLYSLRADGHGTFFVSMEVGVNATANYVVSLFFPVGMTIREIHGSGQFMSWCSPGGNDGFLLNVSGSYPGNPMESLLASKANIVGTGYVEYPIKADFPLGVPISALYLNHFTDGCSLSTFNYTLNGSF